MIDPQCLSSNVPHSQTGLIINSLFVLIINSCVSVWIIIISANKHQNHGFLSITFTCENQYAIDDWIKDNVSSVTACIFPLGLSVEVCVKSNPVFHQPAVLICLYGSYYSQTEVMNASYLIWTFVACRVIACKNFRMCVQLRLLEPNIPLVVIFVKIAQCAPSEWTNRVTKPVGHKEFKSTRWLCMLIHIHFMACANFCCHMHASLGN